MKYYAIILTLACCIHFSFIIQNKKKICPVYIGLSDSSQFDKDVILAFKAAFSKHKIKTISQSQLKELVENEVAAVTRAYFANGGSAGWDEAKVYLSNNQSYVVNSVTIKMSISSDGIVSDTIKWINSPLPMDMVNIKKNPWKLVILDSLRSNNLYEITDQVVENIIASGELAKE
jgi:hypothetical protein